MTYSRLNSRQWSAIQLAIMRSGMEFLRRVTHAGNVYEEHQPLLRVMQVLGTAPFVVRRNRPAFSKLSIVSFLLQSSLLLYCLYDVKTKEFANRITSYSLTSVVYDATGMGGCLYAIITLGRYIIKAKTCMRVWTNMHEMDESLLGIGATVSRPKTYTLAKTILFFLGFGSFVVGTYNLQTRYSSLTYTFWTVWDFPLFHNCLAELAFHVYCSDLRRKFRIQNALLKEDIAGMKNRGRGLSESWRKIRILRQNHYRGYQICKDLNDLYGPHFLYIFVNYFVGGTLNFCIIIRLYDSKSATSAVRYTSAVYWTVIQVVEVLNIVFSSALVKKEVQNMMTSVLEYSVLMRDDDDTRLKLELQSFSLQLLQCQLSFSAAGFFLIDCALLLQLGLAVFSNTLFFVQVDRLRKKA